MVVYMTIAIIASLIIGGIIGIVAVGLFLRPHRDRRHYADTAYQAMVEYGISPSTAELIRQRIEDKLTDYGT